MEPVTSATYADLQRRYLHWAEIEADPVSPLYADWARGLAGDEAMLVHIAQLPGWKRQPNLVFASARMAGVPLEPWLAVREEFEANWPEIRANTLSRSTQTNEPLRMATLLPAIADVRGSVALIEVGASAGLCLYPDRWRYRYGAGRYLGGADRPLLETAASASVPLPSELPDIRWRGGIDLNPLSVAKPDTREWLEALIWPDEHGQVDGERVDRVRTGVAIAKREPAQLVSGDLRTDTVPLIEEAAKHADTVVVWHSAVLAYLEERDRTDFVDLMRSSKVVWVSNEGSRVMPGGSPDWVSPGDFVLHKNGEALALTHPHGRSITWHTDVD